MRHHAKCRSARAQPEYLNWTNRACLDAGTARPAKPRLPERKAHTDLIGLAAAALGQSARPSSPALRASAHSRRSVSRGRRAARRVRTLDVNPVTEPLQQTLDRCQAGLLLPGAGGDTTPPGSETIETPFAFNAALTSRSPRTVSCTRVPSAECSTVGIVMAFFSRLRTTANGSGHASDVRRSPVPRAARCSDRLSSR